LITCIAVIGLAQEASAGDGIDTAYLRGSRGYEASRPVYLVPQGGTPGGQGSAAAPSYPANEIASSRAYAPSRLAADAVFPIAKEPIAPAPSGWMVWTGLYIGGHVGAASAITNFSDPSGPSIFGDRVRTPGFLAGAQIGYNWEAPNSPWVFGLEADLSRLNSDGTNTCLAFSGAFLFQPIAVCDPR
jgi:hypothetical protein